MSRNGMGRGNNPRSRANLAPLFDGSKPGPGRPPLAADVKEARQILKDAAPAMAKRIQQLANHKDPDIAIKAIKVGLDKILPNLEEVENFEHRPLQQFSDEQLDRKLADIRSGRNGHSSGNGAQA